MSFTRVLGPGIHTASNINSHNINSTGIITAVSFVGDGSGLIGVASTDNIVTGTAATFTGGVDINSDLDVDGHTNLDNVSIAGVVTATDLTVEKSGNLNVNIKSTSGWGALEVGGATAGYIDIKRPFSLDFDLRLMVDGNNTYITSPYKPFSLYAQGHRGILMGQLGQTDLRYAGNVKLKTETSGVSVTGILTATSLDVSTDLDVDGHTNLDNVSIAGVTTAAGSIVQTSGHTQLRSFNNPTSGAGMEMGYDGTRGIIQPYDRDNSANKNLYIGGGNVGIANISPSERLDVTGNIKASGTVVATGADINGDLDVDGHTNLDNVSIAGITTFSGQGIHIENANNPFIHLKDTTNNTDSYLSTDDAGSLYLKADDNQEGSGSKIVFQVDGSIKTHITSEGQVKLSGTNSGNHMSGFGSNVGGLTIDDVGNQHTALEVSHGSNKAYLVASSNNSVYMSSYGTGNFLLEHTGGGGTRERIRITSAGSILINNSNGGAEAINLVGNGGGILISRSASGVPNDGQTLGDIGLNSYSSSQTCSSADVLIRGQADGNHSGSSAGSALLLFTKPSSTGPGSAPTERLRITKDGHVLPGADNSYDLGSSTNRWKDLYIGDAHFSNRDSANEIDGTWGDWTLQEGESKIFMINNRTGKKYSLVMEEE